MNSRKQTALLVAVAAMLLIVAGCSPAAAPSPTLAPTATTAPEVEGTGLAEAAMQKTACGTCHVIPGVPDAQGTVGPDLSMIGEMAEEHIASGEYDGEAKTAEEYVRESIVDPDAFISDECPSGPCQKGLMLPTLAESLTPAELDAMVAYLAQLK